ncbi:MAG: hypothetical protein KC457_07320 [Myxococcales bacterium]|nr:hypothetical protein [Myxococcales bacterium]
MAELIWSFGVVLAAALAVAVWTAVSLLRVGKVPPPRKAPSPRWVLVYSGKSSHELVGKTMGIRRKAQVSWSVTVTGEEGRYIGGQRLEAGPGAVAAAMRAAERCAKNARGVLPC